MAVEGVGQTAFGAGMLRALEGHAARPLFDDSLVERLLVGWPAVVVRNRVLRSAFVRLLEKVGPGFYGSVVCRTRVIDDACRRALADGIDRVVILGAGLDTRPYRMPEMAAVRVCELDLPEVQEVKRELVGRALSERPDHVDYVPIDFARQAPGEVLADLRVRTLVVWEAVSMYLDAEAVNGILAYAGSLPPGSRIVLTYLPRAYAEDPRNARWARRLRWRSAFTPAEMAARLAEHGLRVHADLGPEEHQAMLLRPLGRALAVSGGERVVEAHR